MRKGLVLTLIALGFLAVPIAVDAQCRKEIIYYLDASASMAKSKLDSGSISFELSVDALDELFKVRGFFGEDDVIKVRLFGDRVQGGLQAEGPAS